MRPGGGSVTRMSENGHDFVPHTDCVFLVDEEHRLVFTNGRRAHSGVAGDSARG